MSGNQFYTGDRFQKVIPALRTHRRLFWHVKIFLRSSGCLFNFAHSRFFAIRTRGNGKMFGALGPQLQLWRTRGARNTARDISVLDNAFVLIDAISQVIRALFAFRHWLRMAAASAGPPALSESPAAFLSASCAATASNDFVLICATARVRAGHAASVCPTALLRCASHRVGHWQF